MLFWHLECFLLLLVSMLCSFSHLAEPWSGRNFSVCYVCMVFIFLKGHEKMETESLNHNKDLSPNCGLLAQIVLSNVLFVAFDQGH